MAQPTKKPDVVEKKQPQQAGKKTVGPSPVGPWNTLNCELDITDAELLADPTIEISMECQISKDGKTFELVAGPYTINGGPLIRRSPQSTALPGFKVTRPIPDGWTAQMVITTNKPLNYGAKIRSTK